MIQSLTNLTHNIISDIFLTSNRHQIDIATSIYETIVKYMPNIANEATQQLNTAVNKDVEDFINSYVKNKDNLIYQFKSYTDIEQIKHCVTHEVQYIYKNCQVLSKPTDFEVVVNNHCCECCQLLTSINNIPAIQKVFNSDFCDSYLVKKETMLNTDDVINQFLTMKNVPVKYKRSLTFLYQVLSLKFSSIIKSKVKIRFVYEFEEDKSITYKYENDEHIFKFSINTYKHDFVQAILNVQPSEELKKIYYDKIQDNQKVIFNNNKFITYTASQNYEAYHIESLIEYILNPMNLKNTDNLAFEFFNRTLRNTMVINNV